MRFLSLRASFLLAFVVAMPVLALPPVARRIDEWLYGPPPADFGSPPVALPTAEPVEVVTTGQIAPATFVEPTLAAALPRPQAARPAEPTPPPASLPATAPFAPAPAARPHTESRIDDSALARLQQIRSRLEQLGAEYVVVELLESTGHYRFHCRMLIEQRARYTRPFEANSADPVAAGEQVLREVETWRSGGIAAER